MDDLIKIVWIIVLFAILLIVTISTLGAIGSMQSDNGCWFRYNQDASGDPVNKKSVTMIVNSNGNYTKKDHDTDIKNYGKWVDTKISPLEGQNVTIKVEGQLSLCRGYIPRNNLENNLDTDYQNQKIAIPRVEEGDQPVSLYFSSALGLWRNIAHLSKGDRIAISVKPEEIDIKDPTTGRVIPANNVTFQDRFTGKTIGPEDCSEGKTKYHSICGRFSIYSGKFVTSCELKSLSDDFDTKYYFITGTEQLNNSSIACKNMEGAVEANGQDLTDYINHPADRWWPCMEDGRYFDRFRWDSPFQYKNYTPDNNKYTCANWGTERSFSVIQDETNNSYNRGKFICHNTKKPFPPAPPIWIDILSDMPMAYSSYSKYLDSNNNIIPWSANLKELILPYDKHCNLGKPNYDVSPDKDFIMGPIYPKTWKFWYSANDVAGLLYRIDPYEDPTAAEELGQNFIVAQKLPDQRAYQGDPSQIVIYYEDEYNPKEGASSGYLQYRFIDKGPLYTKENTGGYILNIKQTKCRCRNGKSLEDKNIENGKVEYIFVPTGVDPNNSNSYPSYTVDNISDQGDGTINLPAGVKDHVIWIKIKNNYDLLDSVGNYNTTLYLSTKQSKFSSTIIQPLLKIFKDKIVGAGTSMFQNMVCYKSESGDVSCSNFFAYIKGILTLYVILFGTMFILGAVRLDQKTVIIIIIKIIFVAGLMNKTTFNFFNDNVIPFITQFSDVIISNIGGYNIFVQEGEVITNPFMFMDAIMSNMLFNGVFMLQVFALLSLGISGILYFVIVFLGIIIMLICAFRAIAVYLMSYLAICLLIGIAPIFLTFILFDSTKYLFDSWVKFTIRYMFEPTLMMVGAIILTQLFTIYLDFILGYSVCWKCLLGFKLPFPNMTGMEFAIANIDVWCLNWFAPWGVDHQSGMMGVNLAHIGALIIISYCLYGWLDLSSKIVTKLIGGIGPSATSIGKSMSSNLEEKSLQPIGLDEKGRSNIKEGIQKRFSSRNKLDTENTSLTQNTKAEDSKDKKTSSNINSRDNSIN